MTQATVRPDKVFKDELEVFRKEEEVAQQYFFSWLQINNEFAADEQLLDRINDTPLFWITAHHALLVAAFVALGRVFDQGSRHNVDALLGLASRHLNIFTRAALKERKIREGLNPEVAAAFTGDICEPTATDFRELRVAVAKHRNVYIARFRDVRDYMRIRSFPITTRWMRYSPKRPLTTSKPSSDFSMLCMRLFGSCSITDGVQSCACATLNYRRSRLGVAAPQGPAR
jgi:HEPN superfamily AbiU2-like protein